MSDINIGVRTSSSDFGKVDEGNISIKKVTHGAFVDKMEKSTTYQEEYIPPADYPILDSYDPNASTQPPKGQLSPEELFKSNLSKQIADLGKGDLEPFFKNGLSAENAKNLVVYAWNHPGSNVDPAVAKLLQNLAKNATAYVQMTMKNSLPADWQPPNPTPTDNQLADEFAQNFEEALNKMAFTPQDKNALTYAHFHPESAENLKETLYNAFQNVEKMAKEETLKDAGLPADTELPRDTEGFDQKVNTTFTENALDILNDWGKNIDKVQERSELFKTLTGRAIPGQTTSQLLTPEELAELKTLLFAPDANVPNREKLLPFLAQLKDQATAQTAKELNLPGNVPVKNPQTPEFSFMMNSAFYVQFKENVISSGNKFTPEQLTQIMATKGLDLSSLPADLKAIVDSIRTQTLAQIVKQYGLPAEWEPGEGSVDETGSLGTDETGEANETEETKQTKKAWKADPTQRKSEVGIASDSSLLLDETPGVSERNSQISQNAMNFMSSYSNSVRNFGNKYLAGPEAISIGDAMLAVSSALDNLRSTIYQCQMRESLIGQRITRMQQSINLDKSRLQKLQADEAAKKPKACKLFKIFRAIPIVGKLIERVFKTFMWTLDIITGGAISMLCKACGMEPLGENPLLAMGVISKAQAAKMDMALQIIAMVIEIVISVVTAQPQLVMALVAEMTMVISQATAKIALQVGTKLAVQLVEHAVKEAVEQAVKKGIQEGTEAVIKESVKVSIKQGIKQSTKESIKESVQKAMMDAVKENLKTSMKTAVKESDQAAIKATQEAAEKWASKQADKLVEKVIDDVAEEAAETFAKKAATEGVEAAGKVAINQTDDVAKQAAKFLEKNEELYQESLKSLKKAAKKNYAKAKVANLSFAMEINDVLQASMQIIGNVAQIPEQLRLAKAYKRQAKLAAAITQMDTDYKINQVVLKDVWNAMEDMGKWVDQINKQQADYWQKNQIHFIAA